MRKSKHFVAICTVLAIQTWAFPSPGRSQDLNDATVRESIRRGVAFLKSKQQANGGWNEYAGGSQPCGMTALCTLALLNSGVDSRDPVIQKALAYLRGFSVPKSTYAISLQTMVYCAAEPDKDRLAITKNVAWLEGAQIKTGNWSGGWSYHDSKPPADNSNSQFALMALYEAQIVGVNVNSETWKRSYEFWQRIQKPDGAFSYRPDEDDVRGSMVCAGISSLIIAGGRIGSGDAVVEGGQVHCCGQQDGEDRIQPALRWLGKKFSVNHHPGLPGERVWHYYYLYGLERVGRLSGQRFIGQHDWFREGTQFLLSQQDQLLGMWQNSEGKGNSIESNPLIATSFSLLFLSKGRRPVVISKVKLADSGLGEFHRSAVRNLTWRIEKRWKKDLSWQTIDLGQAQVTDLLESPILFLSGRESFDFSAEQKERLKDYVQQGGFIFAEACCEGTNFDRAFRDLMKELFPDSPLRLLPPEHAVWFAEAPVRGEYLRPLYGIDACCRTSVVYCPQNLSCYWELYRDGREQEYPQRVRDEIDTCMRIGENVVTYATNRELKEKLDRPNVAVRDAATTEIVRNVLYIAKVSYPGGGDDAPNALTNLLNVVRDQTQLRVSTEKRVLTATDKDLVEYPIVYMHGRRSFRLTASEREGLATFVERGGVILADAICGNSEFADAFRREMRAILPNHDFARLPGDHPLFSTQFRGFDLKRVTVRHPQVRGDDEGLKAKEMQTEPLLEAISVNDRLAVIFSPYDLSCALENANSLECRGYTKIDAAKLGVNMILYSLQQ